MTRDEALTMIEVALLAKFPAQAAAALEKLHLTGDSRVNYRVYAQRPGGWLDHVGGCKTIEAAKKCIQRHRGKVARGDLVRSGTPASYQIFRRFQDELVYEEPA